MTDRHAGYVVTLEKDTREDDAAAIIAALRMVKGVLDVQPIIADLDLMMAEFRERTKWITKLVALAQDRP